MDSRKLDYRCAHGRNRLRGGRGHQQDNRATKSECELLNYGNPKLEAARSPDELDRVVPHGLYRRVCDPSCNREIHGNSAPYYGLAFAANLLTRPTGEGIPI